MKARFCPVLEDPPCSRCSLLFYQPPSPLALFLPPAVSRLCFSSFFLSIQPFNFCLSLSHSPSCLFSLFISLVAFPSSPQTPALHPLLSSLCLRIIFCQEPLQMNSSTLLSPPPAVYFSFSVLKGPRERTLQDCLS